MCPLVAAVARLTGVHFSFCISAGMVVSTVTGRNLPPYARWPLSFFAMPACIFYSVSSPAWPFRLCRRGISLRVPAGRSHSPSSRRAFFILLPRQLGRFGCAGGEFASVCPLAGVVLSHAGVHLSFCISAGKIVSPLAAWN